MNIVNTAVRVVVVAFVFVAGAITLAGPDTSVSKENIAVAPTAPVKQETELVKSKQTTKKSGLKAT